MGDRRGATAPRRPVHPDDGSVETVLDLDPAATSPAAWGITDEPEGGSPAPTGDISYFTEV